VSIADRFEGVPGERRVTGERPRFFDPDWTPRPEDGAGLLDEIERFLGRFVAFPDEHALVAVTLWAAHSHVLQAFDSTPRLALLSPEPGSGKTRVLEVLDLLCPRPVMSMNATPAYLFRKVAEPAGAPTILYDEIDTVFGPRAKEHEDLRGLLNAGHRRGATAGRCVVKGKTIETEELPAYAAAAMAGLDDLPDTLRSRAVVIRMRKKAPHEVIEPYRHRIHEGTGHALRDRLARWTAAVEEELSDTYPDMPEGVEDRDADVWEALLAIADAAGGDWPKRARVAAVALVAAARETETQSLGIRLLADLRTVFERSGEDKLATDAILKSLTDMDEAPWGDIRGKELNARGLARRLGKYGVKPKTVRIGDATPKGYERADLLDAWIRYLPDSPTNAHTSSSKKSDSKEERGREGSASEGTDEAADEDFSLFAQGAATSATGATADDPPLSPLGRALAAEPRRTNVTGGR
jgi:hypothetical protein